jgi:photosystem II stability/assembly factor-like uncharacterized protein
MKKTGLLVISAFLVVLALHPLSSGSADRPATGSGIQAPASTWKPLGPEGGEIRRIAVNPQDKTELWVLTDTNPSLIFRSNDSGATWKRVAVGAERYYDLICLPSSSVLLALGDTSVYKSSNRGVAWTSSSLGLKNHGTYGRIAVNPKNPNMIYVAGYREQPNYRGSMALLRSADGGKTWSAVALQASSLNGYLSALAVSPANPNIILAAGYSTSASYVMTYHLYKSVNGGKSWAEKGGSISDLVREIAAHPTNPNRFYAVTDYNIWRTNNGAASWVRNNGSAYGYSLTVDSSDPKVLYAGYDNEVFRSVNGGVDWEWSGNGLYGTIYCLVTLPGKVLCASSASIFSTARATGHDAWPTWTTSDTGLKAATIKAIAIDPTSPSVIYVAAFSHGVFKSTDGGARWTLLSVPYDGATFTRLVADHVKSGIIYAMSNIWGADNVYRSPDGGQTWTKLLSDQCDDIALSKQSSDRIFVAGQTQVGSDSVMALHRTLDGGASWTHIQLSSTAGSQGYAVAVDPANDSIIYIGGLSSGNGVLYKSTDQGANWTDITGTLTNRVVAIAVDPRVAGRVYVATYDGVWKSENGGTTWAKKLGAGFGTLFIHPAAPNIVYAAGYNGIFVSKNYGASWAAFDQGLPSKGIVVQLDINKTAQTLYAATGGASVWKRKL